MKFHLKDSHSDSTEFDTIGVAGFAAEQWLNATSKGERYQFEIYQRYERTGYIIKVKDDMGFTVGYITRD